MQYSQKGFQWFAKVITRISFLNVGYGRSPQSLSGHIATVRGAFTSAQIIKKKPFKIQKESIDLYPNEYIIGCIL
jgi:hypothetical protein